MNFQALKWMIENLVKNHRCPMCQNTISEANIDVIGAAGTTININLECPSCKKHTMIRAEIANFDVSHMGMSKEGIENFKQYLENFKKSFSGEGISIDVSENMKKQTTTLIEDSQIIDLSKTLKSKKISASDLFSE